MTPARSEARRRFAALVVATLFVATHSIGAAAIHRVAAGDALPLLAPGDVIVLGPGRHAGPWTLDTADVTLRGDGAVLDGGGTGDALTLLAPGIRVEGLHVEHVGTYSDLYVPDAAVALFGCHGCVIERLSASGITTGVRVEDARDVRLSGLLLHGDGRSPGITAYRTVGLQIERGYLEGFLDGIYLERADDTTVTSTTLAGGVRYGLHVMFSLSPRLIDNAVHGGAVGSVVMFGRGATLIGNTFEDHRGAMAFGLLLQEERGAHLIGNVFRSNALGTLMVAVPGVTLHGNRFDANGVGILIQRPDAGVSATTSMSLTRNVFTRNAADVAVDDEEAALTLLGNAFDRAPALDLDRDGVVDVPYVATSAFAARAARQPDLTLLSHGPGIALWARLEASVPGVRGATFADPAARMIDPEPRQRGAGTGAALLALGFGGAGAMWALGGRVVRDAATIRQTRLGALRGPPGEGSP